MLRSILVILVISWAASTDRANLQNKFYQSLIASVNVSGAGESERITRSAYNQYAYPYYDNYNNYNRRQNDYPPNYRDERRPAHHLHRQQKQHHKGIHVANWRWDEIGVFFTFTAFIVVTGLAKVG